MSESEGSEIQPYQEAVRPEVVKPDQEFLLFDPSKLKSGKDQYLGKDVDTFESGFTLQTDQLAGIPFRVSTNAMQRGTLDIAPFSPDPGYQVSTEDLDEKTRKAKVISEQWKSFDREEYFRTDPLWLHIQSLVGAESIGWNVETPESMANRDVHEQVGHYSHLPEDIQKEVAKLRLQLQFPDGKTYEGIPQWQIGATFNSGEVKTNGYLMFSTFYPAETGPLARSGVVRQGGNYPLDAISEEKDGSKNIRFEGHSIYLPDDIDKVSQVKAVFRKLDKPQDPQLDEPNQQ